MIALQLREVHGEPITIKNFVIDKIKDIIVVAILITIIYCYVIVIVIVIAVAIVIVGATFDRYMVCSQNWFKQGVIKVTRRIAGEEWAERIISRVAGYSISYGSRKSTKRKNRDSRVWEA